METQIPENFALRNQLYAEALNHRLSLSIFSYVPSTILQIVIIMKTGSVGNVI